MALHYRRRGEVWHCRGSIRVGRKTVEMREFSTGCRLKADAEALGSSEEARVRSECLGAGTAPEPPRRITVGECMAVYRARPGGLHPFDVSRLEELETAMGDILLVGVRGAWGAWLRGRGRTLAPSTTARWRSTLLAALSYACQEFDVPVPRLASIRNAETERIAYLTLQQERRLLAAYSPWAAPVMLVLAETGLRTQEALRLDWRQIDWKSRALLIEHTGRQDGGRTKTGRSRRVGMRPVVQQTLLLVWQAQGQPDTGPVFLSKRGKPFADTRVVGGNPLASAHRTACRNAGIEDFRIHDWRHHFAVWFLKRGGNLRALCQIAGWTSMRMVARYAVFEQSDLDDAMLRTAGQ